MTALAWQPLATAPKDGREILGCFWSASGRPHVTIIRWLSAAQIADQENGDPSDYSADWDEDGEQTCATHWMPLPSAPETD